ncbi:entericidin A/B family lipoprotein, partial [Acinetobacter baumannii]
GEDIQAGGKAIQRSAE